MNFRLYILLAAAFLWFVIASVFMYRASWHLSHSKFHKNILIELGVQKSEDLGESILVMHLQGMNNKLGLFRRNNKTYESLLNSMKVGDTISVYYNDYGYKPGTVNMNIDHLEKGSEIMLNYRDREKRDTLIALILYALCTGFLITAFVLNQKRLRKLREKGLEYYGLGAFTAF